MFGTVFILLRKVSRTDGKRQNDSSYVIAVCQMDIMGNHVPEVMNADKMTAKNYIIGYCTGSTNLSLVSMEQYLMPQCATETIIVTRQLNGAFSHMILITARKGRNLSGRVSVASRRGMSMHGGENRCTERKDR